MSRKRLLLVGGGSGGHITPLLAVTKQLKNQTDLEIRLWCDEKTLKTSQELFRQYNDIKIEKILAGKLRRYNHLKWWQHITWSIFWPNFKDFFKFLAGLVQSFIKLIIWRPNLIFAKGGYVCLPVGLVARILRVKVVIHDSDALPGLTNRVLSKSAVRIATGFPAEYYSYPKEKTVFTGIPIRSEYRPVEMSQQIKLKKKLGMPINQPLVLVMGGGLGSRCLNQAVILGQHRLTQNFSVVLASGETEYDKVVEQIVTPVKVQPFYSNIHQYILASDLVICRAGATTLAELASSRKLAIVVPNTKLVGGHQLKNAEVLRQAGAAIVMEEDVVSNEPDRLIKKVVQLLSDSDPKTTQLMLDNFYQLAKPSAASAVVELIIKEVG